MKPRRAEKNECMISALAIVLDEPVATLKDEIGFTGHETLMLGRERSFHIQEFQECCLRRGLVLVTYERIPTLGFDDTNRAPTDSVNTLERKFQRFVQTHRGLLAFPQHFAAWDKDQLYDSDGSVSWFATTLAYAAFALVGTKPD